MPTEVLRVGILCNGGTFQRWQAESIAAVRAEPGVELVLLIERDAETASPKSTWTRALHYPWRTVLYRQYRKHWFRPKAMEPVDLSSELSNVPKIRCRPILRGHAELFEEADLALIRSHRPDVLLRFGFNILHGDILTVATHGVWSHHHGDEEHYRGGPPAFWEIVDAQPVIGAVLQRLTEKLDAGRILYKGWFNTVDHSLEETVDTVLTHSAQWPALVMRRILQGDAVAAEGTLSTSKAPVRKYPTNTVVLRFLWKRMRNKMRFHRDSLNAHEEWNIGVLNQPIHHLLQTEPSLNVRWLPAPAQNSFRADPFGFVGSDGQLHILYEKFDHATGKGEIARLRPKRDNVLKRSRTVLELPEHLSYPFVLERDGEVLVIPEQAARGRVDLYRLDADMTALERIATLLEEPLFDPTVLEWEGRWWMFGTKAPLTNVELFIYHAPRLDGPWTPHTLNPVKADIRSARPGGTPFVHNGALYRPAQDSSLTYGGRIALNRVIALDPERFAEETVRHIGPIGGTAYNKGLHTIAAVGDITVLDGKRLLKVPAKAAREQKAKLVRFRKRLQA
jgi:hypothetical protein